MNGNLFGMHIHIFCIPFLVSFFFFFLGGGGGVNLGSGWFSS